MKKLFRSSLSLAAGVVVLLGANAVASNILTIEGQASGTAVILDSSPVVTAVLSQPGTVNGKTYSTWSFMVEDSSGSMVIFGALPTGSTYTPTIGDALHIEGTYSPYHQIPEIGTLTKISVNSSGNPLPPIVTSTIPTLNQGTLPQSITGRLIELDNVTISGITAPTFGIANLTGKITDADGNNMTFYHWPTSYSVANANLFGMAVPTGPVSIIGFDSVYTSGGVPTAEFTPLQITLVPEPQGLMLVAGLGLLTWNFLRRRAA